MQEAGKIATWHPTEALVKSAQADEPAQNYNACIEKKYFQESPAHTHKRIHEICGPARLHHETT